MLKVPEYKSIRPYMKGINGDSKTFTLFTLLGGHIVGRISVNEDSSNIIYFDILVGRYIHEPYTREARDGKSYRDLVRYIKSTYKELQEELTQDHSNEWFKKSRRKK